MTHWEWHSLELSYRFFASESNHRYHATYLEPAEEADMRLTILTTIVALCFAVSVSPIQAAEQPAMRTMKCDPASQEAFEEWQETLRAKLFALMNLTDLVATADDIPLGRVGITSEKRDGVRLKTISINSTKGRRIQAVVAYPPELKAPAPAVVAIHGHGGSKLTPYDPKAVIYKEFGLELARRGFVVISTDVGQHDVYEEGGALMGERLWDVMRCVDYLVSMEEVDKDRIGCAGLSLGGEMTMWLGAMDPRVKATVSAGFLTYMDRMEQNHCMCWKFDGLRELVDYPDLYAMTAPRALQCQNGHKEPETQFTVKVALQALEEIKPAYEATNATDNLEHCAHEGGHEIALPQMIDFLTKHLAN